MAQAWWRYLIFGLGIIALWIGGVSWLNATLYAPERSVERYLSAVEADDIGLALAVAGMDQSPDIVPDTDQSLSNIRIVTVEQSPDGVLVQARFILEGTEEQSVFTLARRESLWAVFDQWEFLAPPTATIEAEVVGLDHYTVNGFAVEAGSGPVTVLVPGVYTLQAANSWLASAEATEVLDQPESSWAPTLEVGPTPALREEVSAAIGEYLDECATRQVLQPASCPFGVRVTDRLTDLPVWTISQFPAISLRATDVEGVWAMQAQGGTATIEGTLQSLFDGSLRPYQESVPFSMEGVVTGLDGEAPALRID